MNPIKMKRGPKPTGCKMRVFTTCEQKILQDFDELRLWTRAEALREGIILLSTLGTFADVEKRIMSLQIKLTATCGKLEEAIAANERLQKIILEGKK